jgi:lysophospholipase L1-like esterase
MHTPSRAARAVVAALTVLGFVVLSGTAASSARKPPVEYDALGDSYGSGFGVPPYEECGRSQSAYAVRIDGRRKIDLDDFVACAGATTTSLVDDGQLGALDEDTDLVTISIGGNDIGWSTAVVACLIGDDEACEGATNVVRGRVVGDLPGLLDSVYDQVAAGAPNAQVLITGYPRLFSPEYGALFGASPAEQQALNDGADLLNGVIARAAAEHGFRFVNVTKRFLGHGVNAPDAWILGPLDPGAFHPNAEGYETYAAAVTAAFRRSR